eukprot:TRINITY_DN8053_c1_g1_i8.p1 TRINITY_DN8053_c1_g1~~TRINITY_DN8053_c1_g1_i8.p1  ORF type:complete len:108 (-),score=9.08 TRINITY_DN8053_c1_g1_i8:115-438(-)
MKRTRHCGGQFFAVFLSFSGVSDVFTPIKSVCYCTEYFRGFIYVRRIHALSTAYGQQQQHSMYPVSFEGLTPRPPLMVEWSDDKSGSREPGTKSPRFLWLPRWGCYH